MKKTIKGITYDTDLSQHIADLGGNGYDLDLYHDKRGRLFGFERRFRINGKLVPKNKDTYDLFPDLSSRDTEKQAAARKRNTVHDRIIPLTRRKALSLCIRLNIPRTFHKDLARFLK